MNRGVPQQKMGKLVELDVNLVNGWDILSVKDILFGFLIISEPGAKRTGREIKRR